MKETEMHIPILRPKNPFLKKLMFVLCIGKACWTCLYVVLWGLLLSPIRLINVALYQKLEALAWIYGEKLAIFCSNVCAGVPFTISGDYGHDGCGPNYGRQLFVSNHVSSADWYIHLFMAGRNSTGALRFFLKSMHKWVPIAGWACILHDMIFLSRDIKDDRPVIKKQLKSFMENDTDLFMIIYPEGTFTTPDNIWQVEKSHKWSNDAGQRPLHNVLAPRATGFELLMETKEAFDYVVDVTVAFENPYSVKLAKHSPPTIPDFWRHNEEEPVKIHMHYKRYKVSEIKEAPALFVHRLFEEKEDLLEHFDKHQSFPGKGTMIRDSWWDLTLNFLFTCLVEGVTSYFWYQWAPKTFFLAVGIAVFASVFLLWYDAKHQEKKFKPSKKDEKKTE